MKQEGDSDTNYNRRVWNYTQRTNRGHQDYSIKIGQDTEKSPVEMRKLVGEKLARNY